MPTFSGVPHYRKITTVYPSGAERSENQVILTSWRNNRVKTVAKDPPYKPGVFLVKDYYVLRSTSKGEEETLTNTWVRSDGVKFIDSYKLSEYCYTPMLSYMSEATPNLASWLALSLQEAHGKLNAAQWDALVDLAEIGGTLDLVKDGFKTLASPRKLPKFIRDVHNYLRSPKTGKSYGKRFSDLSWEDVRESVQNGSKPAKDLWLTWRYGIMPVVYSIQDALELFKGKLQKADTKIRSKRRRPGRRVSNTTRSIASPRCTVVTEWTSRVEAAVYYRRTMDETMRSALGFSPENLPSAAWEATKLSFVWDWFFNIGDWLSAIKPKFGIEYLGCTTSERHSGKISVIQQFATMQPNMYVSAKPHTLVYESFKRTANPAMQYTPVFTGLDGMNLNRYTDAAGLALNPLLNLLKKAKAPLRKL